MEQTKNIFPDLIKNKIIEELQNHLLIKSGEPLPSLVAREDIFHYFQEEYGIILSPHIQSIYKEIDGFKISWRHDGKFSGEIKITTIGELIEGFLDDFWKDGLKKYRSKEDKIFRQFWENLNSLDVFKDTYDGTLRVVAELKKKYPEPQSPPLWIWHLAGEKYPLTLDIPQYWQALAKTRGFAGWPYFFIDLKKCKFEDTFFRKYFSVNVLSAIPAMEEFLKTMPALFPKDDFSEFESLYKNLKASL